MVGAAAQRLTAREGDNQLVVESVSKRFGGVTAVEDVSIDVPRAASCPSSAPTAPARPRS